MKVISSRELLKTKIFKVMEEVAADSTGFQIKRLIVRHPGSAVMMPVDKKDRVLLVRQFRLPADRELWELPAGRIDPEESALQAAKRELEEETGYRAKRWIRLASFWATPGYVDEKMNLFLALDLTEGEQKPMEDERIETRWFSKAELSGLIKTGKIHDGKTIIGYFLWLEYKRGAQKPLFGR
ncbi:MAG: NUDIX hydrolase [Acidobacteriaceae bacterium]|nr:NUDIX hydrolase [Acidobacteriaceae bacterium]MBV9778883.1 NUDIX hydrolase [Acidobacteriaceae bacterium]